MYGYFPRNTTLRAIIYYQNFCFCIFYDVFKVNCPNLLAILNDLIKLNLFFITNHYFVNLFFFINFLKAAYACFLKNIFKSNLHWAYFLINHLE